MADRLSSCDRLASPDIHLHRVMLSKHRRGPWSSAEDSCLLDLVRTQGASNWVRISQMIGTRSPKQCRERYHQNLKPSLNLDAITPEEGVMIERMVAEMGKRWAEIARRLHGRSDNAVKNWWNGGMNRRKRLDNRRTEVAPRQHHQLQHHQQYAPAQQPYDHYTAQHQQHQASYQPAYPPPQSQPNTHAYPLVTSTAISTAPGASAPTSAASNRYDAPLPSPSAFSTVSRAESADGGAPPSMVSDVSYSTFSHPATPPQSATEQLPPLSLLDSRYSHGGKAGEHHHHHHHPHSHRHHLSPPSSYHTSSSYTTSKPEYSHSQQQQQQQQQQQRSYPLLTERWSEPSTAISPSHRTRSASPASPAGPSPSRALYTGPQLQLPSFSTIVSPVERGQARSVSPGSPTKDGRMDLSKLIH